MGESSFSYSDKPFEMYLVFNAYPDENANAVSRVSGEFKVFKSRSTNLDLGFVGIWLSILVLDIQSSVSNDAVVEFTITFSFWLFRCNLCQMESGVVDIIPVPIVPNCWWKVLTIFGWACPTRNKDFYQFTFSISKALFNYRHFVCSSNNNVFNLPCETPEIQSI